MRNAKTKDTLASPRPAAPTGKWLAPKAVLTTQQKQFSAAVGSIAKRYGVKVASASTPMTNPYAMSAEQAAKIALQAGIINQAGNLTRTFK